MSTRKKKNKGPSIEVHPDAAPVLHLDAPVVELAWVRHGVLHYESLPVEGLGNEVLVSVAKQLIQTAGLGMQPIVVVLASPYFDSRQIVLGRMDLEETQAALLRKAANGIGVDMDEALYWAQRCEAPLAETDPSETTWLVHTQRRSTHHDLLLRLRRANIEVQRVVAGRDVLIHTLDDVEEKKGQIQVTSTARGVYAHLFRGKTLVQESRLPLGDFENRADTYQNVIQDVRQLAAYWAKGSRGAPIEAVHMCGFSELEVEQMRTPLGIAAQGADVRVVTSPAHDDRKDVRLQLLKTYLNYSSRARNLSVPLPPRPSRVLALGLGLSLIAAAGTWKLFLHWGGRIAERQGQISAHLIGTEDVEDHVQMRRDYQEARDSLQASIDSFERISWRGVPLDAVLRHVYGTLGQVVKIRHINFDDLNVGTRVTMEADLIEEVTAAAHILEQLRLAAEADPRLVDVEVSPGNRVPEVRRGEKLTFLFMATYIGVDE